MKVARLHRCTKRYGDGPTSVTAIEDVDLAVGDGELLALVGPSGSGKSTVLSLLGALLTPSSGSVEVDGRDVTALGPAERTTLRARSIGFVFQTSNLVPYLTIEENVAVVGSFAGLPKAEAEARSRALLAEVGLADRATALPRALSGGEQQRVGVARALANDPVLLLADEPTSHLDAARGSQVMERIAALARATGRGGLVVTHDERVAGYADRVVEITDGRIRDPFPQGPSAG